MMRTVIKKLQHAGYTVVAYDTTDDVFYAGDTSILPRLIDQIHNDIARSIKTYSREGRKSFAIFGSSLGSFIAYNCISRLPQLRYGVFNTGGSIAEGMWRLKKARQRHEAKGVTKQQVIDVWHDLQHPDFSGIAGNSYIFISSSADTIAPLANVDQYLQPMRSCGATVTLTTVRAIGHTSSVLMGLQRSVTLLREAKEQLK
ncbi:MAG TPA: hypothetical protein VMB52_00065 [Verrucomicrobiae bacterium]|nr:hypothetical protein [Verrucomicrobiae bacterium]